MDTIKIGNFLRKLRKDKQLTQEQLAEQLNVSRRTISRWETGSNLPDLDLLIELSDFYQIELIDMLNGQTQCDREESIEESYKKIAQYTAEEKKVTLQVYHILFLIGCLIFSVYFIMEWIHFDNSPIVDFIEGFCLGGSFGLLVLGAIVTSSKWKNICSFFQSNPK
ncbi:helix-turn-helix domain-containing protein [Faecalicoccus acidiformans]|uniref:helix-turn-helix domain-containing protein n=1 Tax=Faecalicoccus acidiformans TaxID=915173 RepID=UPI0023558930|nr:helix-turn-helix domain-containing protein [Faecalicoccus acidiformans]